MKPSLRTAKPASGWARLSLGGFWVSAGVFVCAESVNGLCHGLTDGNGWTVCKWESLRARSGCPCGGLWVVNGLCRGITDWNGRRTQVEVRIGVGAAVPKRILDFGGRVRVNQQIL